MAGLGGAEGQFRDRASLKSMEEDLNRAKRRYEQARLECAELRIWVCTWNLGAVEPFPARGTAPRMLGQFVAEGYDIYVICVQEAASEDLFEAMEQRLSMQGLVRLNLAESNQQDTRAYRSPSVPRAAATDAEDGDSDGRPDFIYGRGDGSILSAKFTGLAIYVREALLLGGRVQVCRVANQTVHMLTSKGGCGATLLVDGQTIAFVSCHLEAANKFEERRAQYRELSFGLGSKLGETGVDLCEQFHHVIWCGDLNYRCVQGGNMGQRDQTLHGPLAVSMLQQGAHRQMCDSFDQLKIEIARREVFFEYHEPSMSRDFLPTYKKYENRSPTDYRDAGWVNRVYHVQFREPFYKGGRVKERTPGWCDRILFHSCYDLRDELRPERVRQGSIPSDGNYAPLIQRRPLDEEETRELAEQNAQEVDNYFSVNDGYAMSVSDHSPVVATFLFQSRKALRRCQEIAAVAHAAARDQPSETGSSEPTSPASPSSGRFSAISLGLNEDADRTASAASAVEDTPQQGIDGLPAPAPVGAIEPETNSRPQEGPPLPPRRKSLPPSLPPRPPASPPTSPHHPTLYSLKLHGFQLISGSGTPASSDLKIIFPAPYEAWALSGDSEPFCIEGSSQRVLGSMEPQVADRLTHSGVALVKDASRSDKSSVASTHRGTFMRKSVERVMEVPVSWMVQSNSTGGVTATLDVPDPAEYSCELPWLVLKLMTMKSLQDLHLVMQVKPFGSDSPGQCIVPLEQLVNTAVPKGAPFPSTRFVKTLMYRGLPLRMDDLDTGESELVTMVFELTLMDQRVVARS